MDPGGCRCPYPDPCWSASTNSRAQAFSKSWLGTDSGYWSRSRLPGTSQVILFAGVYLLHVEKDAVNDFCAQSLGTDTRQPGVILRLDHERQPPMRYVPHRDYPELLGYEVMARRVPVYGLNWPERVAISCSQHKPSLHTHLRHMQLRIDVVLRTHHHHP